MEILSFFFRHMDSIPLAIVFTVNCKEIFLSEKKYYNFSVAQS